MRSLFIFAGLVAADGIFDDPMIHPQMKREILEPRQTLPDLSSSCTSAVLGLYSSLPTPPARLVSALGAGDGNPCSASVPSSLNSEYSDYQSSLGSWYSSSSSDVSSAFSACPELSSLVTLLPVCVTSYLGGAVGGGGGSSGSGSVSSTGTDTASGASNTGSSSSSSGGGANSQTTDTGSSSGTAASGTEASATGAEATGTDTGAAARETGFAVAALAAAGAIAVAL